MSADEAAHAMACGIRRAVPGAAVTCLPMADGGEGTTRVLTHAWGGELLQVACHDALHRPRQGLVGVSADGQRGVIEVAQAVGLQDIAPNERDPWSASSYGVGELVTAILDRGGRSLVIGLGGSATNDGGAGMLVALGARLIAHDGSELSPAANNLARVHRLDLAALDPRLADCQVILATDVDNPLLGDHGATFTFGPQKGINAPDLHTHEAGMRAWAQALETASGRSVRDIHGAGAAGGLGAAFCAITHANVQRGIEVVIEATDLATHVQHADWVFAGEGSIDAQTGHGKTPWGVAQVARRHGVPVVLFGGRVQPEACDLLDDTIVALVPITPGPGTLDEALAHGAINLEAATARVAALVARVASDR